MDTATRTGKIAAFILVLASSTARGAQSRRAPVREPVRIHGADAAQERTVDWALQRFGAAGLADLPALDIYLHASHDGCRGDLGYYPPGRNELFKKPSPHPPPPLRPSRPPWSPPTSSSPPTSRSPRRRHGLRSLGRCLLQQGPRQRRLRRHGYPARRLGRGGQPLRRAMTERVVLITGGAGGMGRATAERFLAEGDAVVIADISREGLLGAVADLAGEARTIDAFQVDVSVIADCERMVNETIDRHGRLDVLVNAAGVWDEGPTIEMTEERWDRVLD